MYKKVLVIIAHPDDETIWMGGTILRNINKWDLTIISLCRKNDKDRAPKFKQICNTLKAKCFMSDLEDEKMNDIPQTEIINRIEEYADKDYDYIFTHGKNGEYGHKRHIDVNKAVNEMLKKKMLSTKKTFFFSYTKKGKICYADKKSDQFISLGSFLLKKKKKLIQETYGFRKNSFEDLCCRDAESFKIQGAI